MAARFKSQQVDDAESVSVQCVDINVCKKLAGDQWRERPFKKVFDFSVDEENIAKGKFLGVTVPMLRSDLAQRWLATAYGDEWQIPDRQSKFRRIGPR